MNNASRIILVMAALAAMTIAGAGCGGKQRPAPAAQPGAAFQVRITPDLPDPGTPLSVIIEPMYDSLRYEVQWLANGAPAGQTVNTAFFTRASFIGDALRAKVTAYSGTTAVGTAESPEVTVADVKPVVDSIALDPFPVNTTATSLTVRPRMSQQTPGTTFHCRWVIQGVRLNDSSTTVAVTLSAGQIIFVEVTPYNGVNPGKPIHLSTTVLNGPPVFGGITFVSQDSTGNRYTVTAKDPDGDSVSFQLMGYVKGVSLKPSGALLLAPGVRQTTLTIRASDSRGSWVEQPFTVGQ